MSGCYSDLSCNNLYTNNIVNATFNDDLNIESMNSSNNKIILSHSNEDAVVGIDFYRNNAFQANIFVGSNDFFIIQNGSMPIKIATAEAGILNVGDINGGERLNVKGNISLSGGIEFNTSSNKYKIFTNDNVGSVSSGSLAYILPNEITLAKTFDIKVYAYLDVSQKKFLNDVDIVYQTTDNELVISNAGSYDGKQIGICVIYSI